MIVSEFFYEQARIHTFFLFLLFLFVLQGLSENPPFLVCLLHSLDEAAYSYNLSG